jgi:U2-associated protein SR140
MSTRHRRGAPSSESGDTSSSEEDDVFATLKKKSRLSKPDAEDALNSSTLSVPTTCEATNLDKGSTTITGINHVKASITSSMKRHHGAISSSRKAKMDALLHELNAETNILSKQPRPSNQRVSGSFVQPGEEDITTNLFVGNLAPHLTEEQVYDVFVQFGEIKSNKSVQLTE